MQHHVGDGFADDIGTPHHNHFSTFGFNSGAYDHLLDTGRGTRWKFNFVAADHQTTNIHRMKSVHIFVRINGVEHFLLVDVFGQRQLDQDAIDAVILIVLVDQGQKIRLGYVFRLGVLDLGKTDTVCGFNL